MSVILILILASLAVALVFLAGFIWAVKAGQFEDTCTPAMRILSEDESGGQSLPQTAVASREKGCGSSGPEVGRVSPSAPSAVAQTLTFKTVSAPRGALGETRPTFKGEVGLGNTPEPGKPGGS